MRVNMSEGVPKLPKSMLEGRYLAERPLVRGETVDVFAGMDTWSGEQVAIRRLRPDRLERGPHFRRKSERLFGTTSARLVRAIHFGDDRVDIPFLVTELLHGRSAEALGKVRWEVAAELTRQAAMALSEFAVLECFHGSLEPSTIFVANSIEGGARVKLLDLGVGDCHASAEGDARDLARVLRLLVAGNLEQEEIPGAPVRLGPLVTYWMDIAEATPAEIAGELKSLLDASQELPRY